MTPTSLIIVEDFYDDPDEVRKKALLADYSKHDTNDFHAGRKSREKYIPENLDETISKIVGVDLKSSPRSGHFRASINGEPKWNIITEVENHDPYTPDQDIWMGTVFLTLPEDTVNFELRPYSGLKFWRQIGWGLENYPNAHYRKCMNTKSIFDTYALTSNNEANWAVTSEVKVAYNRLVLFRPFAFHNHGDYAFGTNLMDCRLTQTFFWKLNNG